MKNAFKFFHVAALCAFLLVLSACSTMNETEMTGTLAASARARGGEVLAVNEAELIYSAPEEISYENISYLEISDAAAVCEEWEIANSVNGYTVKHAALQLCPVNGSEDLDRVIGAELVFENENGDSVVVIVSEVGPSDELLNRGVHTAFLSDSEGRIITVMSGDESKGIPETFLSGLQDR